MQHIRQATIEDIPAVKKLAQKHSRELGFVHKENLMRSIGSGLLVAVDDSGQLAGFAHYHKPRQGKNKGFTVLYHFAAISNLAARLLIFGLPSPLRLTVTADNVRAVRFYLRSGFRATGYSTSSTGRLLRHFERSRIFIQVAGNNRRYVEIARRAGAAYGTRHDCTPYEQPFMLDINWEDYDWDEYTQLVQKYRPVMALVNDYMVPEDRQQMIDRAACLRELGVLTVLVCPKFAGAVHDIPADCVVALSVPAKSEKYKGFDFQDWDALRGRKIHLLGGTPQMQRKWLDKIEKHGGQVTSLDGNSHQTASTRGSFYLNGRWYRPYAGREWSDWLFEGTDRTYKTMELSCRLIVRHFCS